MDWSAWSHPHNYNINMHIILYNYDQHYAISASYIIIEADSINSIISIIICGVARIYNIVE